MKLTTKLAPQELVYHTHVDKTCEGTALSRLLVAYTIWMNELANRTSRSDAGRCAKEVALNNCVNLFGASLGAQVVAEGVDGDADVVVAQLVRSIHGEGGAVEVFGLSQAPLPIDNDCYV
jgi:hypothetical protein